MGRKQDGVFYNIIGKLILTKIYDQWENKYYRIDLKLNLCVLSHNSNSLFLFFDKTF